MKLFQKAMMIIGILSTLSIIGYFVWHQFFQPEPAKEKHQEPTVEELIEKSVDTADITTNFSDKGMIKTKFKIITTSKKNAEEVLKLTFLVESSIIESINSMKQEEASGPEGISFIEDSVKSELNKKLGGEYVTSVYLVDKVIQ